MYLALYFYNRKSKSIIISIGIGLSTDMKCAIEEQGIIIIINFIMGYIKYSIWFLDTNKLIIQCSFLIKIS